MSSVIEEPQLHVPPEQDEHGPDVSVLTDKVPEHLRSPRALAGIILVLGLVYLYFCSRPIWHTDIWGHLNYGRLIWETGSIPTTEPLLPFAKGMPFVDSPWLCQLIGFAVISTNRLQLAGLQGLYALAVTFCGAMLALRSYRQTKNGWFSLLSIAVFLLVGWLPLAIQRPQLAGLACFILLLTRMTSRSVSRFDWVFVPVVFALWANLHPSFFVGLGLIGFFCLGRAADVFLRTKSLRAALMDNRARRLFLLAELGAVAVLVNPYTLKLYVEALTFSSNENLLDLTEWHPLTLRDGQGQLFAFFAVLLAVTYRISPRRVQCWEFLSLVGFGLATMWSSRMVIWWAPVSALLMAQHGYAIWRSWTHLPLVAEPAPRTGKWSFVTLGVMWICFMLSPLGIAVIHGKHSDPARSLSKYTPRFAAEYLTKHPPQGPVFNTYEWGDYLQWAGPKGMQLFVNSHAHLVPRDVWVAYMQVIEQRSGWEETLDRYGFNTIVVDLESREPLIKKLKDDERWLFPPVERDGQVIFHRKNPIGTSPAKDGAIKLDIAPAKDVDAKGEAH